MLTLTLANPAMDKSIFQFETYLKTIDDDSVFGVCVCETGKIRGRQSVKRDCVRFCARAHSTKIFVV